MSPRLAFALDAAVQAGRSTLALYQSIATDELKEDNTPVTEADRRAEEILRRLIEKNYPGEAILGEEQGLSGDSDHRWIIDPIDGTKSFVAGMPLYATLLSYEVEGEVQLGIAYFPALGDLVYAEKGQGAFWNGRPCRVSNRSELKRSIICSAGHKGMANHGRTAGIEKLAQEVMATRTWCDAYGHALVATGRVEAMIDPVLSYWDVSAVSLIVTEAGGRATRFDGGNPLLPVGKDWQLVSTNQALHDHTLGAFGG